MIVLVGDSRSRKVVAQLQELGWGRMWLHTAFAPYPGEPWGFDNGAFVAWKSQVPWSEAVFLRELRRVRQVGTPYMAVVPDIVAGGGKSLSHSRAWRDRLEPWPWYLAVQDGMTPAMVTTAIRSQQFAGIFLGGTDLFKLGAAEWKAMAHESGLKFHYGRCGTMAKLDHAVEVCADSCDSAFPLWTKERFAHFVERWRFGNPQVRFL